MKRGGWMAVLFFAVHFSAGAQPSSVRIVRHGEGYQLLRNGEPYFIRGAVGQTRLAELKAAGANSARFWNPDASLLDRAHQAGLSVLFGLRLEKSRRGFDYSDSESVKRQREQLRQAVLQFKEHPALLMWVLGNELEIYTTARERVPIWQELNRVAEMIHEVDPHHPVIYPLGCGGKYWPVLAEMNALCPALDAIGFNSYVTMLELPEALARIDWRRPYLITEFGPRGFWEVAKTPWGVPIEDTSTEKAEFYSKAYQHAVASRPNCLGSYVFFWDRKQEKTHTWFNMWLDDQSPTEAVDVMTNFWTGKWPANRCPRIGSRKIQVAREGNSTPETGGIFPPGSRLSCEVDASDPEGQPLRIEWDLRLDVADNSSVGGDFEESTPPISGAVIEASGPRATIRLPDQPGNYRLFVYVRDPKGSAATANVPLRAQLPGQSFTPLSASPSEAKIVKEGPNYRLLFNGRRMTVRGAKVGSPQDAAAYMRDLAEAGGNAVLTSSQLLDEAARAGLAAVVILRIGLLRAGFDYSDPKQVAVQRERIREEVLRYSKHPALLMWSVGNEPGIRATREQTILEFQAINDIAGMIKQIDGRHPVITTLGDGVRRRQLDDLDRICTNLDAVGLNVYYKEIFEVHQNVLDKGWKRPYLITEFGPTGHWQVPKTPWGIPIEETSTEKADHYSDGWRIVAANSGQCLGALAFLWFGPRHEKTHTWYNMFLYDRSRLGAVDASTFAWTGKWPANRAPRIAPQGLSVEGSALPRVFPAGSELRCKIDASDPDGDTLAMEWDLRRDVADDPNVGGDREEPVKPIPGAVVASSGPEATIRLPGQNGNYRLFVYIRDGRGSAATANIPLRAE